MKFVGVHQHSVQIENDCFYHKTSPPVLSFRALPVKTRVLHAKTALLGVWRERFDLFAYAYYTPVFLQKQDASTTLRVVFVQNLHF